VAGTFSGHLEMRQPLQLAVNQRYQPIQCLPIALIPRQQQLCDLLRHGARHSATEVDGRDAAENGRDEC
jgi:hypothetical protein